MQFIQSQFPVGEHCLKGLLVVLQRRVATNELQHLFQDIKHLFLDLVEHPLVKLARGKHAGVLEINQVPGGLGLCEVQDPFEV